MFKQRLKKAFAFLLMGVLVVSNCIPTSAVTFDDTNSTIDILKPGDTLKGGGTYTVTGGMVNTSWNLSGGGVIYNNSGDFSGVGISIDNEAPSTMSDFITGVSDGSCHYIPNLSSYCSQYATVIHPFVCIYDVIFNNVTNTYDYSYGVCVDYDDMDPSTEGQNWLLIDDDYAWWDGGKCELDTTTNSFTFTLPDDYDNYIYTNAFPYEADDDYYILSFYGVSDDLNYSGELHVGDTFSPGETYFFNAMYDNHNDFVDLLSYKEEEYADDYTIVGYNDATIHIMDANGNEYKSINTGNTRYVSICEYFGVTTYFTMPSTYDYYEGDTKYTANLEHDFEITSIDCSNGIDIILTEVVPHTHTPDDGNKENELLPTCTGTGSYDWVVRCEECKEVISTEHFVVDELGHIWEDIDWVLLDQSDVTEELIQGAENVSELDFASIDTKDKVYKGLCNRAQDAYRIKVVDYVPPKPSTPSTPSTPPHTHTPDDGNKENEVLPTCTNAGSYDWVVRCEDCNAILSTEHVIVDALGHIWDDEDWVLVKQDEVTEELILGAENASELDFDAIGEYDVVYQRLCDRAEDAYEIKVVPHQHTSCAAKKENEILPTCTKEGSYDFVTRCTTCNEILFVDHVVVEPLGHIWEEDDWTVVESSDITKELIEQAENAADIDFDSIEANDVLYQRLCDRAEDAYELKLVKAVITGKVSGHVIDVNGQSVKDAKVVLHSTERIVYTDENGYFEFKDVDAGDHKLWVYMNENELCEVSVKIDKQSSVSIVSQEDYYKVTTAVSGSDVTVDVNGIARVVASPQTGAMSVASMMLIVCAFSVCMMGTYVTVCKKKRQ